MRMSPKLDKLRKLPMLALLLTLPACGHLTPTAAISPVATAAPPAAAPQAPSLNPGCTEFDRITFDRLLDTLPTVTEIKAYDAARDRICGVGK